VCRAGLCSADTRVLVSFELRSSAVKETFLAEAAKAFTQVGGWGQGGAGCSQGQGPSRVNTKQGVGGMYSTEALIGVLQYQPPQHLSQRTSWCMFAHMTATNPLGAAVGV
jgi:hypothetical protein